MGVFISQIENCTETNPDKGVVIIGYAAPNFAGGGLIRSQIVFGGQTAIFDRPYEIYEAGVPHQQLLFIATVSSIASYQRCPSAVRMSWIGAGGRYDDRTYPVEESCSYELQVDQLGEVSALKRVHSVMAGSPHL